MHGLTTDASFIIKTSQERSIRYVEINCLRNNLMQRFLCRRSLISSVCRASARHKSRPPNERGRFNMRLRTDTQQAFASSASVLPSTDRQKHNELQAETFDERVGEFEQPLPEFVHKRLRLIACSVPGLGQTSRVIDVGSGTGNLIPYIQECGVHDILAVDVSPKMLEKLASRFPKSNLVGNESCVRTWCGDVCDLPPYQGSADALYFNAVFGNLFDQHQALLHSALYLCKSGGHIVISHPLGRKWLSDLHDSSPAMVPHVLPDESSLRQLARDLPLRVVQYMEEEGMYIALLQVPVGYQLEGPMLKLEGDVVVGFGRGSKQMGVPTANLDPTQVAREIDGLPAGVYFGWAQLCVDEGEGESNGGVHKMVMNIGYRPTMEDGSGVSVEVHVLHDYGFDFHGQRMKVLATSYIRPEMKFPSIGDLVERIKADVAVAKYQLDIPQLSAYATDEWFNL